jgi:hypothetical protein
MRTAWASWQRFWFEPEETTTLGLVRIAFGVVVMAWTVSLAGDAHDFFTPAGLLPDAGDGRAAGAWSVLDIADDGVAVSAVLTVLFLASACLAAGQWTRLMAIIVFVGLVSLDRRNPFVFNAGDGLLTVIAFCLIFAPAGASLSLDRWRRGGASFWGPLMRSPWALRLIQVQLSVVYLSTVWSKLRGESWTDGTAVGYALGLDDLSRVQLPAALLDSEVVVNFFTYGTLAVEAAVGLLVWNRRLRPWVLGLGAVFHVGIDLTVRVGFFSYAMLVLYLAFIPPEAVRAWAMSFMRRVRPGKAQLPLLARHETRR